MTDPSDPSAPQRSRGFVCLERGDFEGAADHLRRVLTRDGADLEAITALRTALLDGGVALALAGRFGEAVDRFLEIVLDLDACDEIPGGSHATSPEVRCSLSFSRLDAPRPRRRASS